MSEDSGQINRVGVNQKGLLQHTFAMVFNGGVIDSKAGTQFLPLPLKSLPVSLVIHRDNVHGNIILLVGIQACNFHPHGWKHSPRKIRVEIRKKMVNKENEEAPCTSLWHQKRATLYSPVLGMTPLGLVWVEKTVLAVL